MQVWLSSPEPKAMMDNHQDPPQHPSTTSQVAYYNSGFKHAILLAANQKVALHPHPSTHTLWVHFQWSPTGVRLSQKKTQGKQSVPWRKLANPLCSFRIALCLRHSALLPEYLGGEFIMNARCHGSVEDQVDSCYIEYFLGESREREYRRLVYITHRFILASTARERNVSVEILSTNKLLYLFMK